MLVLIRMLQDVWWWSRNEGGTIWVSKAIPNDDNDDDNGSKSNSLTVGHPGLCDPNGWEMKNSRSCWFFVVRNTRYNKYVVSSSILLRPLLLLLPVPGSSMVLSFWVLSLNNLVSYLYLLYWPKKKKKKQQYPPPDGDRSNDPSDQLHSDNPPLLLDSIDHWEGTWTSYEARGSWIHRCEELRFPRHFNPFRLRNEDTTALTTTTIIDNTSQTISDLMLLLLLMMIIAIPQASYRYFAFLRTDVYFN